jgi:hypothetical protein
MRRSFVLRTHGLGWRRPERPAARYAKIELVAGRPARIEVCLEASEIGLMGAARGLSGQIQTPQRRPDSRR